MYNYLSNFGSCSTAKLEPIHVQDMSVWGSVLAMWWTSKVSKFLEIYHRVFENQQVIILIKGTEVLQCKNTTMSNLCNNLGRLYNKKAVIPINHSLIYHWLNHGVFFSAKSFFLSIFACMFARLFTSYTLDYTNSAMKY